MRISILLLLYFGCFVISLKAQGLIGQVVDRESKEPIPSAVIQLSPTPDLKDPLVLMSDSSGSFSYSGTLGYPIYFRVTILGYRTKDGVFDTPPQDGENRQKIYMEPSITLLNQVVISAGKFEQKVEETTISLDVIQPYLVQEKNPLDIQGTFDQSPGVNVTDGQANIRSGSGWSYGTGTRVLVLLDDMPMISADANQVQWTLIPLEALGQMEVIKGASSALYGSSAMNGIVNVRTMVPGEEPETRVTAFQGLYDTPKRSELKWWDGVRGFTGLNFYHTAKKGETGYLLSGNFLRDPGYEYQGMENRGRIFFKVDHGPEGKGWHYGITGGIMNSENGDALIWNSYDEAYIPLDSNSTITRGWDFHIDPRITYSHGNSKQTLRGRFLSVNNNARSLTTNYDNFSRIGYAEYQYQQFFSHDLIVTGGLVGSWGRSESEVFNGTYTTTNLSAYLQGDWSVGRWHLSAGGRYESFRLGDRFFDRPVFRAGANFQAARGTFLRASIGQGFRFPSIGETYPNTNVGAIYVYPNPELQPEEGYSAEIGIKQGVMVGEWSGFLDLAAFVMDYDNMMEFSFGQWGPLNAPLFGNGFKSLNIGPTRISGLEFTIVGKGKVGPVDLRILGGYTFADPRHLAPDDVYAYSYYGKPVTYRESGSDSTASILKYRYRHIAKLDVQGNLGSWMLGASVRMNSFMENIDAIFASSFFESVVPGIPESRNTLDGPATLLDMRIGRSLSEHWKLTLIVNNLLNTEHLIRPAMLGPSRQFILQVSATF